MIVAQGLGSLNNSGFPPSTHGGIKIDRGYTVDQAKHALVGHRAGTQVIAKHQGLVTDGGYIGCYLGRHPIKAPALEYRNYYIGPCGWRRAGRRNTVQGLCRVAKTGDIGHVQVEVLLKQGLIEEPPLLDIGRGGYRGVPRNGMGQADDGPHIVSITPGVNALPDECRQQQHPKGPHRPRQPTVAANQCRQT